MTLREKFLNAMRRGSEEYIPFEFDLCPVKTKEFMQKTGKEDYFEYYAFPYRWIGIWPKKEENKYHRYYKSLENIILDEWGVGYKAGSVAHFTEMQHPMKDFESMGEFETYPYVDPVKDYFVDDLKPNVDAIKEKGVAAVAGMQITIFEIAWYLRGMDNFMIDLVLNPELANYHLDRITAIRCNHAGRYAAAGCDVLFLGDDVSTQLDMMMNPDTWREFFKPRLEKVIQSAKDVNPDILIAYHGDGNLKKIIPDLIEAGVNILNPIQPECIDPVRVKKEFGDSLSFWGTIGTQTTMPFGTAEEVRRECRKMIMEVGKGGGLMLSPTHTVEPEVPWDNIMAFIDTVNEYNSGKRF